MDLFSSIVDQYGPPYDLSAALDTYQSRSGEDFNAETLRGLWSEFIRNEAAGTIPRGRLFFYLHVPFCERICRFCRFYVVQKEGDDQVDTYLNWLEGALDYFAPVFANRRFDAMYIGGGTPSILSVPQIERLCKLIFPRYSVLSSGEFTFECHPAGINRAMLDVLARYGVNRISMGVQTFDTTSLDRENRGNQTTDMVQAAIDLVKEYPNFVLNLDLIMGLQATEPESYLETFRRAIKARPTQISTYALAPAYRSKVVRLGTNGDARMERYLSAVVGDVNKLARDSGYISLKDFHLDGGAWQFAQEAVGDQYVGYSDVGPGVDGLFGIGPVSRSRIPASIAYAQNEGVGKPFTPTEPIARGRRFTALEEMRDHVAQQCRWGAPLDLNRFKKTFGCDLPKELDSKFSELESDGLLQRRPDEIVFEDDARARFLSFLRVLSAKEVEKLFGVEITIQSTPPVTFRLSRAVRGMRYMESHEGIGISYETRGEVVPGQRPVVDLVTDMFRSVASTESTESLTQFAERFMARLDDRLKDLRHDGHLGTLSLQMAVKR